MDNSSPGSRGHRVRPEITIGGFIRGDDSSSGTCLDAIRAITINGASEYLEEGSTGSSATVLRIRASRSRYTALPSLMRNILLGLAPGVHSRPKVPVASGRYGSD